MRLSPSAPEAPRPCRFWIGEHSRPALALLSSTSTHASMSFVTRGLASTWKDWTQTLSAGVATLSDIHVLPLTPSHVPLSQTLACYSSARLLRPAIVPLTLISFFLTAFCDSSPRHSRTYSPTIVYCAIGSPELLLLHTFVGAMPSFTGIPSVRT